jgi:hypothetical protein
VKVILQGVKAKDQTIFYFAKARHLIQKVQKGEQKLSNANLNDLKSRLVISVDEMVMLAWPGCWLRRTW